MHFEWYGKLFFTTQPYYFIVKKFNLNLDRAIRIETFKMENGLKIPYIIGWKYMIYLVIMHFMTMVEGLDRRVCSCYDNKIQRQGLFLRKLSIAVVWNAANKLDLGELGRQELKLILQYKMIECKEKNLCVEYLFICRLFLKNNCYLYNQVSMPSKKS
jgi:hypothetical protein